MKSAIQDAIRQGKYKAVIDLQRSGNPYEISKILISALEDLGYKASYYSGCQLDPAYDFDNRMVTLQDVLDWFNKEPRFKPKGKTSGYWYGTYEGRSMDSAVPTFIHFDGKPFGDFSMGDFNVRVCEECKNQIQLKVDVYLNSYCAWDTCFEGIVPSIEFLNALFYDCFRIPRP